MTNPPQSVVDDELVTAFEAQRPRLVRLCALLCGDTGAAEDLAQETLLEAWRQRAKLVEPAGVASWLAAIARNVCLRWRRQMGRRPFEVNGAARLEQPLLEPTDPFDFEVELERDELAALLDRALALLPPETRAVLVARYVAEAPLAEIAARLRLSEGAVAVRLHRGKAAFRRVLTAELGAEAAAHGLIPSAAAWQTTAIWCPLCSGARLEARIERESGTAMFRCPGCAHHPRGGICTTMEPGLLAGVRGYKPILSRQIGWLHSYYRAALAGRPQPCPWCGGAIDALLGWVPPRMGQGPELRGLELRCRRCGAAEHNSLRYLVLDMPETQRFWRANPRMRVLPDREIAFAGQPAVLTRFESVVGPAHLDIISAVDTFAVLAVDGAPAT